MTPCCGTFKLKVVSAEPVGTCTAPTTIGGLIWYVNENDQGLGGNIYASGGTGVYDIPMNSAVGLTDLTAQTAICNPLTVTTRSVKMKVSLRYMMNSTNPSDPSGSSFSALIHTGVSQIGPSPAIWGPVSTLVDKNDPPGGGMMSGLPAPGLVMFTQNFPPYDNFNYLVVVIPPLTTVWFGVSFRLAVYTGLFSDPFSCYMNGNILVYDLVDGIQPLETP